MNTWDETIPDDVLWKLFPEQCFPDIEGMTLRIGENALHICAGDSEWALQSDIPLADGHGCMLFYYTGDLSFKIESSTGVQEISMLTAQQKGLPAPQDVLIIKRGDPWEFTFSLADERRMKIYAQISAVSWNPVEKKE
ncbi:MAG: hypothetical protein LBQ81_10730 [Zoogloeaceae bacterium]|jgi:hypothetical protein|nr:hypothetical protein [Zoogloeaceae bacterium]